MARVWEPPGDGAPWIASVGHSDHPLPRFFALLSQHGIRTVVDVRRFPRSRSAAYDKVPFSRACREADLTYHHLEDLGGKRTDPYSEHMRSSAWIRAYDRLRTIALAARHEGGLAVFMCVERDPASCHRLEIATRLRQDGWRVLHLLPDAAQTRLF